MKEALDQVQSHWRILQDRWRGTADGWNDRVRHQFEREFWEEYERVVPSTLNSIARLEEALKSVRHHVR